MRATVVRFVLSRPFISVEHEDDEVTVESVLEKAKIKFQPEKHLIICQEQSSHCYNVDPVDTVKDGDNLYILTRAESLNSANLIER